MTRNDISQRFRLVGELDGQRCVFPLKDGPAVAGSGRNCHIRLTQRGVSRRHAQLMAHGQYLEVRDLDSKNGTFINGERIELGQLRDGDQIGLGPVHLSLQVVDAGDAELGLVLDPSSQGPSPSLTHHQDTTLLSRGETPDGAGLRVLESVVEHLLLPSPDLDGALQFLVPHLGATSGCWAEWPQTGPPVVLAAVGAMATLPSRTVLGESIPSRRDPALRYRLEDSAPFATTVARWQGGQPPFGLVLWGDFTQRRRHLPLISTILRLAQRLRPKPLSSLDPQPTNAEPGPLQFPEDIVRGESASMKALYQQMRLLLQGDVPTLILGETGVGKEHLAATLHRSSARSKGPLVAINCAAIPAELLEAEMFGIGRGVATGVQPRVGKFQEAEGGTLFLDEIGDMSPALQAKLLRALQEKEIHPLGLGSTPIDVRIISATNTDLRQRIQEGKFREDLYYRLAGYILDVPPLRRRENDIRRLIAHFIRQFCTETGKSVRGLTVKALRALEAYPWPGNVRELEHEVRRLVYVCPDQQAIDSEMLSHHILAPEPESGAQHLLDGNSLDLEQRVEALQRQLIRHALVKTGGNQSKAARLLNVSRNGLAKRLKRLAISLDEING